MDPTGPFALALRSPDAMVSPPGDAFTSAAPRDCGTCGGSDVTDLTLALPSLSPNTIVSLPSGVELPEGGTSSACNASSSTTTTSRFSSSAAASNVPTPVSIGGVMTIEGGFFGGCIVFQTDFFT